MAPLPGHLVREDELQFGDRDEPARPTFRFLVPVFLLSLLPTRRLPKEQDARAGHFEVSTLDRGTVLTEDLHGGTLSAIRPGSR
jgi:hypothetical protein